MTPYRYVLRRGGSAEPLALWVMLNPSTADETNDDPTIRRVIAFTARFAERAGVVPWRRGFTVVNLFARRATDPRVLTGSFDDIGPENDRAIAEEAEKASLIVCAWGANKTFGRVARVLEILGPGPKWCLGTTKSGAPRHPLYVKADQPLEVFR